MLLTTETLIKTIKTFNYLPRWSRPHSPQPGFKLINIIHKWFAYRNAARNNVGRKTLQIHLINCNQSNWVKFAKLKMFRLELMIGK